MAEQIVLVDGMSAAFSYDVSRTTLVCLSQHVYLFFDGMQQTQDDMAMWECIGYVHIVCNRMPVRQNWSL